MAQYFKSNFSVVAVQSAHVGFKIGPRVRRFDLRSAFKTEITWHAPGQCLPLEKNKTTYANVFLMFEIYIRNNRMILTSLVSLAVEGAIVKF